MINALHSIMPFQGSRRQRLSNRLPKTFADGIILWQAENDTYGYGKMRNVLVVRLVWLGLLPTNALAERYVAECVIVEITGAIVTDGSPQYYSGFQNTYQKVGLVVLFL